LAAQAAVEGEKKRNEELVASVWPLAAKVKALEAAAAARAAADEAGAEAAAGPAGPPAGLGEWHSAGKLMLDPSM